MSGLATPAKWVRQSLARGEILGSRMSTSLRLGLSAPRLAELSLRDAHRLGRRLEGARASASPRPAQAVLDEIAAEAGSPPSACAAARGPGARDHLPRAAPGQPEEGRDPEAIRDHQVVIVAGETGSGKTTQIPKICLELGRGVRGMIGHTQPRRIAARTVAERVAEELGTPLGEAVGWKVRFTDQVDPDATFVKLMTDGILLAEIQTDRELRAYDTIIIDEAHERQPQHRLPARLPRPAAAHAARTSRSSSPPRRSTRSASPGTSATPRSSRCSGRTYPVEVRYRPLLEEEGDEERPRPDHRDLRRRRRAPGRRARATSWSSSPASARSATPPTRWTRRNLPAHRGAPPLRAALARRAAPRLPAARAAAGSCWRPTSPRRR